MRRRRRGLFGMLPPLNPGRPGFFGPGRRGRGQQALGPRPRMLLAQAHRMMASGDFSRAYQIFSGLAEKAQQRGIPEPAAQVNLEAGRALLEMGDGKSALARAQTALGLLLAARLASRAEKVLPRVIQ